MKKALVIVIALVALLVGVIISAPTNLTGVNLSCAEFAASKIPGVYNKDYTLPTTQEVDYFRSKGANLIRLPLLWERLEPNHDGPLDPAYSGYADTFISYATSHAMNVIIDPHNYARYYSQIVGQSNNSATVLGDLWALIAKKYAGNSNVIFGLMNEPHDMTTENWLTDANTAIAAIRAQGAKNLILVPGNGWTGAWTWTSNSYGTPNSQVMLGVKDPDNNFVFEVHQYLDSDGSGSHAECVNSTIGVDRVTSFTNWARTNKYKAILGEFAGANNTVCQEAITGLLNYMEANQDVWLGWSWWAAGPWWGTYMFSIEPTASGDAPQMAWLAPHWHH